MQDTKDQLFGAQQFQNYGLEPSNESVSDATSGAYYSQKSLYRTLSTHLKFNYGRE